MRVKLGSEINLTNSVFVIFCASLVLLMAPALAIFYSGMVKHKNALSTSINCIIIIAIVGIEWVILGYSLSFGGSGGIIGDFSMLGLSSLESRHIDGLPMLLFAGFQMCFAIIAATIIVGSFVERVKFSVLIIFALLWSIFVYNTLAHWVWSENGWLRTIGSLDFAGGGVVHISAGVAGLVGALMLGKNDYVENSPHNMPLTFLGVSLLWFGWLGFNAGSALAIDNIAIIAFLNTNVAAFAGIISWVMIELIKNRRVTLIGSISGAVAGLVAITPACGFVGIANSIFIGFISSIFCYFGINYLKHRLRYDDRLDVFGLHGIGGIWGGIATGLFANEKINPIVKIDASNGLVYGGNLLIAQLIAIVAIVALSGIGTFVILKAISLFTNLRVTKKAEINGLDISLHGEKAYNFE